MTVEILFLDLFAIKTTMRKKKVNGGIFFHAKLIILCFTNLEIFANICKTMFDFAHIKFSCQSNISAICYGKFEVANFLRVLTEDKLSISLIILLQKSRNICGCVILHTLNFYVKAIDIRNLLW